ncbi:hypothetical protein GH714_036599 [Hevea brasiliensis]|uniref:Uncharacterized protein n=1 Tax=Hevea brasiliensis TaxID=3981 RepID=A0A6A6NEV3_HEVBR|nr:hypothetical protein GH714_036599 [Hevea brasiliensis]
MEGRLAVGWWWRTQNVGDKVKKRDDLMRRLIAAKASKRASAHGTKRPVTETIDFAYLKLQKGKKRGCCPNATMDSMLIVLTCGFNPTPLALCRNSVAPLPECSSFDSNDLQDNIHSPEEILASGYSTESPNFPTNVLFWGDQTQVSTGGGGGGLEEGTSTQAPSSSSSSSSSSTRQDEMLVIDIPVQMSDNFPEEESKSPMPTQRLRSLKRLLSREKRVAPGSSSSVDV